MEAHKILRDCTELEGLLDVTNASGYNILQVGKGILCYCILFFDTENIIRVKLGQIFCSNEIALKYMLSYKCIFCS